MQLIVIVLGVLVATAGIVGLCMGFGHTVNFLCEAFKAYWNASGGN